MEITAKVRFQSTRQRIESYGGSKYLIYLTVGEEDDFMSILRVLLSKYLGVPPGRIAFLGKNYQGDFIFSIT